MRIAQGKLIGQIIRQVDGERLFAPAYLIDDRRFDGFDDLLAVVVDRLQSLALKPDPDHLPVFRRELFRHDHLIQMYTVRAEAEPFQLVLHNLNAAVAGPVSNEQLCHD